MFKGSGDLLTATVHSKTFSRGEVDTGSCFVCRDLVEKHFQADVARKRQRHGRPACRSLSAGVTASEACDWLSSGCGSPGSALEDPHHAHLHCCELHRVPFIHESQIIPHSSVTGEEKCFSTGFRRPTQTP